tara:strand:+ start:147 stop:752 length:606 start_codon:yes stop_codon:yes gene_type:complete
MDEPLINILTRTSGRPKSFSRCVDSIQSQTYKNIKHIVSVDDDLSYEYASKLGNNIIKVEKRSKILQYGNNYKPYNFYINDLLEEVDAGYIIFLDDDDFFTSPDSLKSIISHLNKDTLLMWLVNFCGTTLPNGQALASPVLLPTQVTGCSFAFHSKHKWAAKWDGVRGADYRCAQRLSWLLGHKWLHKSIVTVLVASGGNK